MRLFVLGKRGSVTHWTEDAVAGFRAAGHDVCLGSTRNPIVHRSIEQILLARWTGAPLAARIRRAVTRFSPDLILAITAYHTPVAIVEHLATLPNRPPMVGWVGDLFSDESRCLAGLFDAVAYTDTGLLGLHNELGFPSRAVFLPHAASPRLRPIRQEARDRQTDMVFVANPTPHRLALVGQVRTPMQLYGPGWHQLGQTRHQIHPGRVGLDELAAIYGAHLAVLNVRNEGNVLTGLNQRHFDPYLLGTAVVSDDPGDLSLCFEPGLEVLVYRDADELNDIYARLQRHPEKASAIGEAGRRRVLAEHTYGHRLAALAKLSGTK